MENTDTTSWYGNKGAAWGGSKGLNSVLTDVHFKVITAVTSCFAVAFQVNRSFLHGSSPMSPPSWTWMTTFHSVCMYNPTASSTNFYPENGNTIFLRNIGIHLRDLTVPQPRRPQFENLAAVTRCCELFISVYASFEIASFYVWYQRFGGLCCLLLQCRRHLSSTSQSEVTEDVGDWL
jgi:hypothetical protein